MAYPTTVHIIFRYGGNASFDGQNDGATLEKIGVWVGGLKVNAVRIWLTNGKDREFGTPFGACRATIYNKGPNSTVLPNNPHSPMYSISETTAVGETRLYFHVTSREIKSSLLLDITLKMIYVFNMRASYDVIGLDNLWMSNMVAQLLQRAIQCNLSFFFPRSSVVNLKKTTYCRDLMPYKMNAVNTISPANKYLVSYEQSKPGSFTSTFNMQVKAGIPELAEVSTGFSWTVGTEDTYKLENKTETTEKLSFKIQVPAGKTMEVAITLGHANVDLPYKGTVKVTCRNGSVLRFDTSGVYKGLTYTKGSVVVKEG
uniref:Jacalin-type lectin domain-containing protein n=1 Tax=Lepisosteus oculatus TaxID=7918 RepID=W5LXF1_LEPOC